MRARGRAPGSRERGIALIAVLWALVLISVIAAAFVAEVRSSSQIARNLVENAKARALADGAVYYALSTLVAERSRSVGGNALLQAVHRMSSAAVPTLRADGTPYDLDFADGRASLSVQDEAGKINLNLAPLELLTGLFVSLGVENDRARALAGVIVDFRKPQDQERPPAASAAGNAGLAYGSKPALFTVIEELRQVPGMMDELYVRVVPFSTVYGTSAGVDVSSAPRQVLMAIPGLAPSDVDTILAMRKPGMLPPVPAAAAGYVGGSGGTFFAVTALARTQGGATFVRETVAELTGDQAEPFRLRAWRQGRTRALAGRP